MEDVGKWLVLFDIIYHKNTLYSKKDISDHHGQYYYIWYAYCLFTIYK